MAMVTGAVSGAVTTVMSALSGAVGDAMSAAGAAPTLLALPAREVDPETADRMPGLGAFIVFAFLAVALYFLLKNMNARLRRMSYREKEREAQAAAQAPSEPASSDVGSSEVAQPPADTGAERGPDDPDPGERG